MLINLNRIIFHLAYQHPIFASFFLCFYFFSLCVLIFSIIKNRRKSIKEIKKIIRIMNKSHFRRSFFSIFIYYNSNNDFENDEINRVYSHAPPTAPPVFNFYIPTRFTCFTCLQFVQSIKYIKILSFKQSSKNIIETLSMAQLPIHKDVCHG